MTVPSEASLVARPVTSMHWLCDFIENYSSQNPSED